MKVCNWVQFVPIMGNVYVVNVNVILDLVANIVIVKSVLSKYTINALICKFYFYLFLNNLLSLAIRVKNVVVLNMPFVIVEIASAEKDGQEIVVIVQYQMQHVWHRMAIKFVLVMVYVNVVNADVVPISMDHFVRQVLPSETLCVPTMNHVFNVF